MIMVWGIPARR